MFPGNGISSLPTTALEVPRGTSVPGGNLLGAGTPRLARSTVLGDRQDPILSISLIILVSALSRVGSPADGVELTLMSLATYLAAEGNSTRVTAHCTVTGSLTLPLGCAGLCPGPVVCVGRRAYARSSCRCVAEGSCRPAECVSCVSCTPRASRSACASCTWYAACASRVARESCPTRASGAPRVVYA